MSFQLATRLKLRFPTNRGMLTTEQLWDLPLNELDELAVELEQESKRESKTFLKVRTQEDKTAKVMFDVVYEILNTKVEENEKALKAQDDKEHNQKILRLMAEKKDEALKGMSIEELESQLR